MLKISKNKYISLDILKMRLVYSFSAGKKGFGLRRKKLNSNQRYSGFKTAPKQNISPNASPIPHGRTKIVR